MQRFLDPLLSIFANHPVYGDYLTARARRPVAMPSQSLSQDIAMLDAPSTSWFTLACPTAARPVQGYPAPAYLAPAPAHSAPPSPPPAYYTPAQPTPGQPTAAQRALLTPELVGEIMSWLVKSRHSKQQTAKPIWTDTITLAHCARVNHVWFREATRRLWTDPSRGIVQLWTDPLATVALSLPQMLAKIETHDRQYYANFISHATLIEVQKSTVRTHNKALRRITFPRLETLSLILDYSRPLLFLPNIHVPALKTFHIRLATVTKMPSLSPASFQIQFRSYPWRRRHMLRKGTLTVRFRKRRLVRNKARMIARQIQARFGGIKAISFGPEVVIDSCALKVFEDAFPGVVFWTEHPGYLNRDSWQA